MTQYECVSFLLLQDYLSGNMWGVCVCVGLEFRIQDLVQVLNSKFKTYIGS